MAPPNLPPDAAGQINLALLPNFLFYILLISALAGFAWYLEKQRNDDQED